MPIIKLQLHKIFNIIKMGITSVKTLLFQEGTSKSYPSVAYIFLSLTLPLNIK